MAKRFLTPTGLVSLASDPATGSEGNLYFNNADDVIKIYRNGAWQNLVHTSEEIQDIAAELLNHDNHVNLSVEYNDASNQLILTSASSTLTASNAYYGSFYDTTTQSASVVNTAFTVEINTTVENNGIRIDNNISGRPTRLRFLHDGVYNIQFSAQLYKPTSQAADVYVWIAKNGTNVAHSAGTTGLTGNNSKIVVAWNYVMTMDANDFLEFKWSSSNDNVEMLTNTSASPSPQIPSIIVTAQQIAAVLPGGGGSGSTNYLNDLLDVSIINPENHQLVGFNYETGLWKNLHPAELGLATITDLQSASTSLLTSASTLYIPKTDQQGIINTASAAAVSYVVDSAPGALDTLNELAAALNDDANFASTVVGTIASASAAAVSSAVSSASANTVSQINALTTSDIEEGSRLYFTNTRGLTTASTALVHGNHTNITASYNSASNQIILVGNTGGGGGGGDGASVIYSTEQPDTSQLTIGDIWVDSNASVGYSGSSAPYVNQLTYWLEDDNGNLLPDADNVYSVGSSAFRVKDLYLGASSLYIKSPNSNTNIPMTLDTNNDITFNGSKIITLANAQTNLNLSTYATQSYARSASANAFNSASSYVATQLAGIDLSSTIQTASAAAVNYLIDSAPGSLDTLNELSAALNDDPNFYSTIQSVYLTKSSASTQYEKLIPYSSSTPSTPSTGDMWVDSNNAPPALKVYNGTDWVQLGAAVDDSQAIISSRMFA